MKWEVTFNGGIYEEEEPYALLYNELRAYNADLKKSFIGDPDHYNLMVSRSWVDSDSNTVTEAGDVVILNNIGWCNEFVAINSSASDILTFAVSFDGTNYVSNSDWTVAAGTVKELYLPYGAIKAKLTTAGTASTGRILGRYNDQKEYFTYNSGLLTKVGAGTVLTKACAQPQEVFVANHGAGNVSVKLSFNGVTYFVYGTIASGGSLAFNTNSAVSVQLTSDGNTTCRLFSYNI